MKQNYNLLTHSAAFKNAWNNFYQKSKIKTGSLLVVLFTLLGFSDTYGQFNIDVITPGGPTNFSVPAGVTSVTAAVWGAGGGGGGCSLNNDGGNGGGGGGATSATFAVLPTQTITYTVGQGGSGGTATGGIGNNGTLSSITHTNSGTTLIGNPGTGGRGNQAALNTPTNSGGGSASGGTNSNGSDGTIGGNSGGNGGNSGTALTLFGTGATGNNNSTGANGGSPGAGGAGGEYGPGNRSGGAGGDGRIVLRYISVTNISPNPACIGSTITITGTNFAAGASTVTINGTSCTSVTYVNSTTITAVVATGTTSGTVLITNPNGTNNGQSITVTPLPVISTQPVATSICTTGSGTFSVVAAPATTYQWRRNGVVLTNTAPYSGVGTATLTITNPIAGDAGNFDVIVSNGTCSVTSNIAALTITTVPATAATPTPTNGATGVCYSGGGAVSSISWGAAAGATSYDVYFGAGSVPGTVTANVATNSYTTGALTASTIYYWRVVAKNACGDAITSATFSFTTAATPCTLTYCAPAHTVSCATTITNVTFNTINNTSGCADTNGISYTNYAAGGTPTTSLLIGSTYNLNITTGASAIVSAWIDYNANGTFEASEWTQVYTTGTNGNVNILIPLTATPGITTIRIRSRTGGNVNGSGDPCTSFGSGESEDYQLTLVTPPPCAAPTAQPTALSLTASGTIVSGSFTAASPAADSYLAVISTNPVAPTPTNGTTYSIGGTVGAGYTVVGNTSATAFSATGLSNLTTYYIYVFSFNNLCTGGPLYLTTTPLTGNITTTAFDYCIPTSNVSTRYIDDVLTVGNITNLNNMGTGRAATGYADYTATPPVTQIPGGGVAIDYRLKLSRQFVKIWVDWDNNGTFTDAAPELVYTSGGVQTIAGAGGFVVPPATLPGNYRIRIRTYEASQTFGPCGNLATGEAEDYLLTVVADCAAKPTVLHDGARCDVGTVVLGVEGAVGVTQFRFYDSLYGGTLVGTAAAVPGITNWTTPAITTTTTYYVTAYNGVCESWYRQEIEAKINPVSNIVVTPSVPEVCGENNVVQISAGGDFVIDYLVDEEFEGGGLGALTRVNVAANADTQWTNRTSPYVPVGAVWKPAITSKAVGNMFLVANSDFAAPNPKDTQIRTANLNATVYSDLFLSFRHYFSYYPGEPEQYADVDVSTNGGTVWTSVANYTSNQGYAGQFNTVTLDLTAYAGQPQVMIRFRYHLAGGSAWGDGWAVDDVKVYGTKPLNTTFTWSGGSVDAYIDPACLIPYVAQSVTTVYVKPDAMQLASPSWSFTATATLGNGCPISELISIDNKTKLWVGSASNDWQNPNNWSPVGVPDANTCVIIYDGPFDSNVLSSVPAFAKTLIVRPNGDLQIHPSNTVTVTDAVTIDAGGIFNIKNSGSLVQINNVANTGIMNMERITQPMYRLDYTYWNSPVTAASGYTLGNLTTATSNIYNYTPTQAGGNGIWSAQSAATVMSPTRGYIARAPLTFPSSGAKLAQTVNFIGTPNNGDITMPISKGTNANIGSTTPSGGSTVVTDADDEWNLIGNPYPSAIDIVTFLTNATNTPVVDGTVYLWTHNTQPTAATPDPFYGNYVYNYTINDYATVNSLGTTTTATSGGTTPSRYIGAGQSFFISAAAGMANGTTSNVIFNNSMRVTNNNNFFMRTENENSSTEGHTAQRVWLNLSNNHGGFSQILVGYAEGATLGWDRGLDGEALAGNAVKFYSFTEDKKLTIQGRPWPFVQEDIVPIGFKATVQDNYTIGIDHIDQEFNGQNIFLEDRLLNVIHNLKLAPYNFTSQQGTFDTRFALRYTENTLSNTDITALENSVYVYNNGKINVKSTLEVINEITVFDVLGRTIGTYPKINSNDFEVKNILPTTKTLIVKIELANGTVITKKVLF